MIVNVISTYIKPFGSDTFYRKTHTLPDGMTLEEAHDYYWESCYAAWKDRLFEEFFVDIIELDTKDLEKEIHERRDKK